MQITLKLETIPWELLGLGFNLCLPEIQSKRTRSFKEPRWAFPHAVDVKLTCLMLKSGFALSLSTRNLSLGPISLSLLPT